MRVLGRIGRDLQSRALGSSGLEWRRMGTRVHGSRLVAMVASIVILTWSCGTEERDIGTLTLADGSNIAPLLANESCSVVLMMSPQECLSCTGILEAWAKQARDLQFGLHLLLSATPSAKQVESLRLRRVPLRGVVSKPHARSETTAFLFEGGMAVDSIVGLTQQTQALGQLMEIGQQNDSRPQPCSWKTIGSEGVGRR